MSGAKIPYGPMWGDEERTKAARLLRQGLSASKIAKHFGMSRSAVLGRVRRDKELSEIGFKSDASHRTAQNLHPGNIAGKREGRAFDPGYVERPKPPDASAYDATARMTPLVDMTKMECRFPIGDPREDGFGFCGHARHPGYPYCLDHCRRAYSGFEVVSA